MPSNTPSDKKRATKNANREKFQNGLDKTVGKIFNTRLSAKAKPQLAAIIAAIVIAVVLITRNIQNKGFLYDLIQFLADKEQVNAWVLSMGIFAPLAFIGLQILQTVISPIPGNVVGFAGGFLFGWWGVILSTIGSTIGYAIVLKLVRKYGRRLVEKLISPDLMKKFDYLANEKGGFIFFLIFLIPALPDDVVMCIAGLTKLPINQLLFSAAVGRLPSVVITNQFGASISDGDIPQVILLTIISLAIVGLCIWKREAIMAWGEKSRQSVHETAKVITKPIEGVIEKTEQNIETKIEHRKHQKTKRSPRNKK